MKRFFYKIEKIDDPRDYDYQRIFAQLKTNTLRTCYIEANVKFRAYAKLLESNFSLLKNDETWQFIDEPFEYYQDIQSMSQLLAEIEARK